MRFCKCGCGKIVKTKNREYARGCRTRGKTYMEIYGVDTPSVGFKCGIDNIAKQYDVREKIRQGVLNSYKNPKLIEQRVTSGRMHIAERGAFGKLKYKNSLGERYRSKLEVYFSEILIKHKIKYEYEYRLPLNDGTTKVVDFKVGDTLIEITGYAYKKWREQFNDKLYKMRKSCNNQIILLTYPATVDLLKNKCPKLDASVASIYDEQIILEKIKFCSAITTFNHIINDKCI